MSTQFTCDDKQTLIAYLYGEVDAVVRKAVDDHLARCRACAAEVMSLGDVRSELGLWLPPEVELDFTIVRKSQLPASNVLHPAKWWQTVPVWAQAAAAILVIAAGAAIANVQVKSGPEGFVVSTGWMQSPAPVAAAGAAQPDQSWKPALVALEQQLRDEINSRRDQPVPAASRGSADEATVRRVQQLLADAEQRQQRELAARFIELTRDMTMQRRADMQRISGVLGSYDEQLLRQRQMIRVSSTPQQ
jgi:hypothetical protein